MSGSESTAPSGSLFDRSVKVDWEKLWAKVGTQRNHTVECDDAEGFMRVIASCDGDFHLTLDHGRNQTGFQPTFRARTFQGGGRNDRVRKALALLALAIAEDTENAQNEAREDRAGKDA